MAVGTRLTGKALYLTFKKGAAAAVILGDDVKTWTLDNEPKDNDNQTFGESGAGLAVDWTLTLNGIISFSTGSLWNFLWDNPGSDIVIVIAPFGNTTPSVTQPHFTLTVNTGGKPAITNTAGDTEGAEFEVALLGSTDVTKVTA